MATDKPVSEMVLRELIAAGEVTDPESARGRLLAAAASLFREKGYSRTTVRDIAAAVGILSGSIFHHFKNKDEILYAVMYEVVVTMTACLKQAVAQAQGTREKVRALLYAELSFINQIAPDATAVLVYEWRALSEERQQALLKVRKMYEDQWLAVFTSAESEGLTRVEPFVLRQLIHGALSWSTYWFKPSGKLSLDELVDAAMSLVLKD